VCEKPARPIIKLRGMQVWQEKHTPPFLMKVFVYVIIVKLAAALAGSPAKNC
jgi:hypothetical protein